MSTNYRLHKLSDKSLQSLHQRRKISVVKSQPVRMIRQTRLSVIKCLTQSPLGCQIKVLSSESDKADVYSWNMTIGPSKPKLLRKTEADWTRPHRGHDQPIKRKGSRSKLCSVFFFYYYTMANYPSAQVEAELWLKLNDINRVHALITSISCPATTLKESEWDIKEAHLCAPTQSWK